MSPFTAGHAPDDHHRVASQDELYQQFQQTQQQTQQLQQRFSKGNGKRQLDKHKRPSSLHKLAEQKQRERQQQQEQREQVGIPGYWLLMCMPAVHM